jgi:hypothetical protein
MQRRTATFLLISVLILAAFLRTYHLRSAPPGLYPDEAMNGNNALEALMTHHFKVFYPENNGREGLFINIQALSLWTSRLATGHFVTEAWALRFPSTIIGILTVLGMYFLARELFADTPTEEGLRGGRRYGALAAFLLATSTWHLIFSRDGFRAVMAPLMLVWTLYFVLRAMRELRAVQHVRQALWWMIAGAVTYGLGFYTYLSFRLTPILLFPLRVFGTVHFSRSGEKTLLKHFASLALLFGALAVIVALPLGFHFFASPTDLFGRVSQVSVWNAPHPWYELAKNTALTFGMFFYHGDWNWRQNLAGSAELWWPVAILFAIGLLLCIYRLAITRRTPLRYILCLSCLVVGVIPGIISDEGIPHAARTILALPAALLIAALGGVWLYDHLTKRAPRTTMHLLLGVFVAALSVHAYVWYFHDWAPRQETQDAFASNYVAIGRVINALPAETPKYVIVQPSSVDVRGLPVRAQTTMFITNTFLPEGQAAKNVHYVLPDASIPQGAVTLAIP